jgi:hypothetical protein
MPKTGRDSGAFYLRGEYHAYHTDAQAVPQVQTGSSSYSIPYGRWYKGASAFGFCASLGTAGIQVQMYDEFYANTAGGGTWTKSPAGSSEYSGYPGLLPDPTGRYATASVRGIRVKIGTSSGASWTYCPLGYYYWDCDYPVTVPKTGISFDCTVPSSLQVDYSLKAEALEYLTRSGLVSPYVRTSWWNDSWGIVGTVSSDGTETPVVASLTSLWNSDQFPGWAVEMTYFPATEADDFLVGGGPYYQILWRYLDEFPGYCTELEYGLSPHYPGLRLGSEEGWYQDNPGASSWAEYRVVETAYGVGALLGTVQGTAYMASGSLPSAGSAPAYYHREGGRVLDKRGYSLETFDQMEEMEGLKAVAVGHIDGTVSWESGSVGPVVGAIPYVLSNAGAYSTKSYGAWLPAECPSPGFGYVDFYELPEFDLPATVEIESCLTSKRYDQRFYVRALQAVGKDEDLNSVWPWFLSLAKVTDASLQELDLPAADDLFTFELPGLDEITGEGEYDDLVHVYRQSPLSVAWAQDDRGASEPPSWWEELLGEDEEETATLTRTGHSLTAVLTQETTLVRTLHHHVWDRWTAKAELGDGFNWQQTAGKTKHILAGETMGTFTVAKSEDVYNWSQYRYLALSTEWSEDPAEITLKVTYSTFTITDNHSTITATRSAGWVVHKTEDRTAEYTIALDSGSRRTVIDLFSAQIPHLQVVEKIELIGLPAGTLILSEMDLIGYNPDTEQEVGDFRIDVVHPRRMRYGGLGMQLTKAPEEATCVYGWAEGLSCLRSEDGELLSVSCTPEGLENVERLGGAYPYFESYTFEELFEKLAGTWGQEGLYGALGDKTSDDKWTDGDDENYGPLNSHDWKESLDLHIADANELDVGRTHVGGTAIPYCLRTHARTGYELVGNASSTHGHVALAEGARWANDGDPIILHGKKVFYGSRPDVVYRKLSETLYSNPGSGLTFTLKERNLTDDTERTVCTAVTDAWGRLRPAKGVNEYKHTETGSFSPTNPDIIRDDFNSYWVAPDNTVSPSRQHYQECPSTGSVEYIPIRTGSCIGTSCIETPHEFWVLTAYPTDDGSDPPQITVDWYDPYTPQSATIGTLSNGRNPKWFQGGDGIVWLSYVYAENHSDPTGPNDGVYVVSIPIVRLKGWPPEEDTSELTGGVLMFPGYTCHCHLYDKESGILHFVGYKEGGIYYIQSLLEENSEHEFTQEAPVLIAEAAERIVGIELLADGSLMVTYEDPEYTMQVARSTDMGATWA